MIKIRSALSSSEMEGIVKAYKDGKRLSYISFDFGRSVKTIRRVLIRSGAMPTRSERMFRPMHIEKPVLFIEDIKKSNFGLGVGEKVMVIKIIKNNKKTTMKKRNAVVEGISNFDITVDYGKYREAIGKTDLVCKRIEINGL